MIIIKLGRSISPYLLPNFIIKVFLKTVGGNDFMRIKTKDKGYTITELLVIISILTVLLLIFINFMQGQAQNAREQTDAKNAQAMQHAISRQVVLRSLGHRTFDDIEFVVALIKQELGEIPEATQDRHNFYINIETGRITARTEPQENEILIEDK